MHHRFEKNHPGKIAFVSVCAAIFILACSGSFVYSEEILIDDFVSGLHPSWREKVFNKKTAYSVIKENNRFVVKAESRASASALYREVHYNIEKYPFLLWSWKIDHVLSAGDGRKKEGDDYAARVYVVFPSWLFWKTKSITYVWASKLPAGKILRSPYTPNVAIIVLQTGNGKAGQWVRERRNVLEDYRNCFKEDPPERKAIAMMTDTDNTKENAIAWYGPISIAPDAIDR
jgi:hypothetical protein